MYGAAAKSVRVPKTAELVASRIRKAIISGSLKTGDRLPPEAQLIADFEVSRPTVREAIRILESEGFLQIFDPALQHYSRAFRLGDPNFPDTATRA